MMKLCARIVRDEHLITVLPGNGNETLVRADRQFVDDSRPGGRISSTLPVAAPVGRSAAKGGNLSAFRPPGTNHRRSTQWQMQ